MCRPSGPASGSRAVQSRVCWPHWAAMRSSSTCMYVSGKYQAMHWLCCGSSPRWTPALVEDVPCFFLARPRCCPPCCLSPTGMHAGFALLTLTSGKQRGSFRTHAAPLGIAVYGHPPTVAVSLWSSSDVVLYREHCGDRDTGWHIAKIIMLARYVRDLWFSSNGSMLVVVQQACCYVGFWDIASSRMVKALSFMQPPQTIEVRNDGCAVALQNMAFL